MAHAHAEVCAMRTLGRRSAACASLGAGGFCFGSRNTVPMKERHAFLALRSANAFCALKFPLDWNNSRMFLGGKQRRFCHYLFYLPDEEYGSPSAIACSVGCPEERLAWAVKAICSVHCSSWVKPPEGEKWKEKVSNPQRWIEKLYAYWSPSHNRHSSLQHFQVTTRRQVGQTWPCVTWVFRKDGNCRS